MEYEKIKPGKFLYLLAVILFIAGTTLFVFLLVKSINGFTNGSQRIVVPGKMDISLDTPGHYTIFLETSSVVDGKIYHTNERSISGLTCSLTSKDTNEIIKISPSHTNSNYHIGQREGTSFLEFDIQRPGTYEFTGWYSGNQNGPEVVLAIGYGTVIKMILSIFFSIGILLATIGVSLTLVIVNFIRRSRYR